MTWKWANIWDNFKRNKSRVYLCISFYPQQSCFKCQSNVILAVEHKNYFFAMRWSTSNPSHFPRECKKGNFRHLCSQHLESILCSFEINFTKVWGLLCIEFLFRCVFALLVCFWHILGPFWVHFWVPFWSLLGPFTSLF